MGNNNTEFAIDLAFDLNAAVTPDGVHYPMEWGLAFDPGTGWQTVPITDRHAGDFGFGTASIDIDNGDTLTLSLFSFTAQGAGAGELESVDWVRYCFRPAHDIAPGNSNLKTSPFNADNTNDLLKGIDATGVTWDANASSKGLDQQFECGTTHVELQLHGVNGPLSLRNIPAAVGDTFNYEFTAYLKATDGTGASKLFKTDPELITGRRG